MSSWLIAVIGVVYLVVAVDLFRKGQVGFEAWWTPCLFDANRYVKIDIQFMKKRMSMSAAVQL